MNEGECMRKCLLFVGVVITVFLLTSCHLNSSDDEKTRVWDKDSLSTLNNSEDFDFSEFAEGIFFTRKSGSTGIVGTWTRQTTAVTYINGMQTSYNPIKKTVIYNADGTYSMDAETTWKDGNGFMTVTTSVKGIYTLYNSKGSFRLSVQEDGYDPIKYTYIVSNNYLYLEELSDLEKHEEKETFYSIKYQISVNIYNEAIDAINKAEDYSLIKISGEVTPAELQGIYATISNNLKYIGLDLTDVSNLTKYDVGFENEYIFYVALPTAISELGDSAFSRLSRLQTIILPNSVTSIPDSCFYECFSLHTIELPNNLTIIENGAFSYSGLNSIVIPKSVISVGGGAFMGCDLLRTVKLYSQIPPTYESTEGGMFGQNRLLTIYVPNSSIHLYKNANGWKEYAKFIKGY